MPRNPADKDPAAEQSQDTRRGGHLSVQGRFVRALIVIAGIVLAQGFLYWPSLTGKKILLPLDILAWPGAYLPITPETAKIIPQDSGLSDLVYLFEPARRFAVSELGAGRLPQWTTYQYAGSPFIWPKFSPFLLLESCTASPMVLAWGQVLAALVAGIGAYLFFRRALGVRFWAAAIAAWCYPLTGFLVLWQGYPTCGAVICLPWLLLAVDHMARQPGALALAALGAATGIVLVSGHADVAGQVLLVSGCYAAWCILDRYWRKRFEWQVGRTCIGLLAGFSLGLLLASPYLLPVAEYARTSARLEQRNRGQEERPPIGLAALPLTVLPDMYGSMQCGSLPLFPKGQGSLLESSAGAYAGLVGTLLVAPLAWCSRRHRSVTLFWLITGLLGLSWCLDVPGVVTLLRLPGLNVLSNNRLVFSTAFALLAMIAVGLDALLERRFEWQKWFQLPVFLLAVVGAWSVYRAIFPPEPIGTQIELAVRAGSQIGWVKNIDQVREVQAWFTKAYLHSGLLCAAGLAGWLLLWLRKSWQSRLVPLLGFFLLGDLVWFAYGRSPQCDPALYYPAVETLERLAKSEPGRMIGYQCLPATLAGTQGLRDVRGYDGIDPARLVELLDMTADPGVRTLRLSHAATQWLVPRTEMEPPDGIKLPPILDMLGVRYVVFRGSPPAGIRPSVESFDYYALVNHSALPRVYIPQRVETVAGKSERLAKLGSAEFNPRTVAYVETPVTLPVLCRGAAEIATENPTDVAISLHMETAGLVVLADLWDTGWRAYLNGKPAAILRANHALRGVVALAGEARLEFRYEPASLAWGLRLSAAAAATIACALGFAFCKHRFSLSQAGPT